MAAIDEIDTNSAISAALTGDDTAFRRAIAFTFWRWYHSHTEMKIVGFKLWIIKKTIRVGDLRRLFELLFGPDPAE